MGAAVDMVMMLVGAMLEVVRVQSALLPIALGLVKVLPSTKVKLWPVVFKLLST